MSEGVCVQTAAAQFVLIVMLPRVILAYITFVRSEIDTHFEKCSLESTLAAERVQMKQPSNATPDECQVNYF